MYKDIDIIFLTPLVNDVSVTRSSIIKTVDIKSTQSADSNRSYNN